MLPACLLGGEGLPEALDRPGLGGGKIEGGLVGHFF